MKAIRTRPILNFLEISIYSYLATRLASHYLANNLWQLLGLASILAIGLGIIAPLAKLASSPLTKTLKQSPPFAISAIMMMLMIMIILNLQTDGIFCFTLAICFYTRFIKGLASGNKSSHINPRKIFTDCSLSSAAIVIGIGCSLHLPALTKLSDLAQPGWRLPFILACSLSLYAICIRYIFQPALLNLKRLQNKASTNKHLNPTTVVNIIEALLLCSFLIVILGIGGIYWLQHLLQTNQTNTIIGFLISSLIFIFAIGIFKNRLSTFELLSWGCIGTAVTAPLQFLIGDSSNIFITCSGQAFFMVFAAAATLGVSERLSALFKNKLKLGGISICWILSMVTIGTSLHKWLQHAPMANALYMLIVSAGVLWITLQMKMWRVSKS